MLATCGRGDVELERKADCRDAGNRCMDGGRLAMKKYKSKIAAAVHEAMQDARDAGVIDKRTLVTSVQLVTSGPCNGTHV
jgi:hypothetical protein